MKILFQTEIQNMLLSIKENWDLEIINTYSMGHGNKTISKDKMQTMVRQGKNINRIHKPIPVLFWQDCKNGLSKNWSLIK